MLKAAGMLMRPSLGADATRLVLAPQWEEPLHREDPLFFADATTHFGIDSLDPNFDLVRSFSTFAPGQGPDSQYWRSYMLGDIGERKGAARLPPIGRSQKSRADIMQLNASVNWATAESSWKD